MIRKIINLFFMSVLVVCVHGNMEIAARSMDSDCINHGDVNLDGTITAADAQRAFYIVLGIYSPTFEEECAADCNGNGQVTAADAQAIFQVVLGQEECEDPLNPPDPTPTPPPAPTGFVYIPPGTCMLGSPDSESCRDPDEIHHQVTLTRGFYMMTTEVTRQMWAYLKVVQPTLPTDPSDPLKSPTLAHPVQHNTWYEAVLFANLLSLQHGFTRCYYTNEAFTIPVDATNYTSGLIFCDFNVTGYRLPTEAEWEYAARAGTTGPFSTHEPNYSSGNCNSCSPSPPLDVLDSIAWWCGNGESTTQTAGTKLPNPWGLYDMHGNVWEWCWDRYGDYPSEPVIDPTGPSTGSWRIFRGGGWNVIALACRSAYRGNNSPVYNTNILGFRLIRSII